MKAQITKDTVQVFLPNVHVLTVTWFKQDLQKLVCDEVLSADVHKVTEGKHNGNL